MDFSTVPSQLTLQKMSKDDIIDDDECETDLFDSDVTIEVTTQFLNPPVPEGGWGWMCVLGCGLINFVYAILGRSFAVIYLQMMERYDSSDNVTAWVGAINFTLSGLLGPVTSVAISRFSCRTVTIWGGVLLSLGVIGTGLAPNILTCYFTFGVMVGSGLCFIQSPGYIIINEYFDKRKGLAMGVGAVTSGIGKMGFPPLMLVLFNQYGYMGAFLIIAAICLHSCVAGALFRPINVTVPVKASYNKRTDTNQNEAGVDCVKKNKKQAVNSKNEKSMDTNHHRHDVNDIDCLLNKESQRSTDDTKFRESLKEINDGKQWATDGIYKIQSDEQSLVDEIELKGSSKNVESVPLRSNALPAHGENLPENKYNCQNKWSPCSSRCDSDLSTNVTFVGLCLLIFGFSSSIALNSGYDLALSVERGVEITMGTFFMSIAGISSMVGCVGSGIIFDLAVIRPHRLVVFSVLNFVVGLNMIANALCVKVWQFIVVVAVRAFCASAVMAQRTTIVSDIVGKDKTNNAFGILLFVTALAFLLGRVTGGTLKDLIGTYSGSYFLIGGCNCLVFVVFHMMLCHHRARHRESKRKLASRT